MAFYCPISLASGKAAYCEAQCKFSDENRQCLLKKLIKQQIQIQNQILTQIQK